MRPRTHYIEGRGIVLFMQGQRVAGRGLLAWLRRLITGRWK